MKSVLRQLKDNPNQPKALIDRAWGVLIGDVSDRVVLCFAGARKGILQR